MYFPLPNVSFAFIICPSDKPPAFCSFHVFLLKIFTLHNKGRGFSAIQLSQTLVFNTCPVNSVSTGSSCSVYLSVREIQKSGFVTPLLLALNSQAECPMTVAFSVSMTKESSAFLKLILIHAIFHTSPGVDIPSPTYSLSHSHRCSSHHNHCLAPDTTMAAQGSTSDCLHTLLATSTAL